MSLCTTIKQRLLKTQKKKKNSISKIYLCTTGMQDEAFVRPLIVESEIVLLTIY